MILLFAGCGNDTTDEPSVWVNDVAPLFEERCVFCHAPTANVDDTADFLVCACQLDMSGDLPASILGIPSTQSFDMALVEPGDHLYSYLWHKINGTQAIAAGSGTSMPLGSDLTESEIDAVAAWIDAGAVTSP